MKAGCIAHGCRTHRASDIEMNNVGLGLVDFPHGEGRCPVVSLVFKNGELFLAGLRQEVRWDAELANNYAFLFAILAGNVSSVRFAGSLRFAGNGTFRAKSVTRKCDQDLAESGVDRGR
jgi:hypothetical protein